MGLLSKLFGGAKEEGQGMAAQLMSVMSSMRKLTKFMTK